MENLGKNLGEENDYLWENIYPCRVDPRTFWLNFNFHLMFISVTTDMPKVLEFLAHTGDLEKLA